MKLGVTLNLWKIDQAVSFALLLLGPSLQMNLSEIILILKLFSKAFW